MKMQSILPTQTWLRNHGHQRLADAIDRHPEAFRHIQQEHSSTTPKSRPEKKPTKLEERVQEAEQLAACHDGQIPCAQWLVENGYTKLYGAMWRNPTAFNHLGQNRRNRRPQDWVTLAEELAAKCGGTLSGIAGLVYAMKKHPDLFAHIPQKRLR